MQLNWSIQCFHLIIYTHSHAYTQMSRVFCFGIIFFFFVFTSSHFSGDSLLFSICFFSFTFRLIGVRYTYWSSDCCDRCYRRDSLLSPIPNPNVYTRFNSVFFSRFFFLSFIYALRFFLRCIFILCFIFCSHRKSIVAFVFIVRFE